MSLWPYRTQNLGAQMKRNCHHCGTRLRLRQMRCRYCRRSAVNWLHRIVIAAFAVTAVFYLLKTI